MWRTANRIGRAGVGRQDPELTILLDPLLRAAADDPGAEPASGQHLEQEDLGGDLSMLDDIARPPQRHPPARSPGPPFIELTRFWTAEVNRGADRALGEQRYGFPGATGAEPGLCSLAPDSSH